MGQSDWDGSVEKQYITPGGLLTEIIEHLFWQPPPPLQSIQSDLGRNEE